MTKFTSQKDSSECLPALIAPGEIPLSTWKTLLSYGHKKTVRNKQILFKAGQPATHAAIVISGFLILKKGDTIIDILKPGNSAGGMLVGANNQTLPYPIDVQAFGNCEVLEIPTNQIAELLKLNNEVSGYFHEQFRQRMQFLQSCRLIQSQAVPSRIAHFLISKKDLLKTQLLTRKIIAQATSSTTETVIRILLEWQKNGIVKFYGRKLIILNPSYLESLCATVQQPTSTSCLP